MKKFMVALMIIFLSAALSMQSNAGEHEHGKKSETEKMKHACYKKAGVHRGGYIHTYIGMYKEHAKELGLTKEQTEKMAALDKECNASCDRLTGEVESAESALDELVKRDVIDMAVVEEKVKAVHDLKAKLELAHFELLSKAQQILTPEQREKCRNLCEKKTGKKWPMVH